MPISISCGRAGQRYADRLAARVAQADRAAVVAQRGVQHVHEHRLVARGHQRHVRQAAQVGDVEHAVVRRAVVADEARAVHREHHRKLLQAQVVDDLVVGALQERRVDRGDGARALQREAGGEQAAPAARRCRRRSSGRASPSAGCSGPCPEFIAAVMPTTRVVALALGDERVAEHLRVLRAPPACRPAWTARASASRSSWASRRATSPCPRARRPRPARSPCPSRSRSG